MHTVKPAQLIPGSLALICSAFTGSALAQEMADTEPAAAAPAPPPVPAPAAEPAPAEVPSAAPPQSAPPPAQGKMVIAAPPVPRARERRGYHVHDGFYLRLGVGLGLGRGQVTADRDAAPDFELGGGGAAFNVWAGGTPWSGVAIGGLLSAQTLSDGDVEVEGNETNESMGGSLALIGVFIDAFPDPQRGLHLGGALGLGGLSVRGNDRLENRLRVEDFDGGGVGASGWVGYMGFVGPEWSLGGMLQLTGVITGQKEDGLERRGSAWGLNLSFSALYH